MDHSYSCNCTGHLRIVGCNDVFLERQKDASNRLLYFVCDRNNMGWVWHNTDSDTRTQVWDVLCPGTSVHGGRTSAQERMEKEPSNIQTAIQARTEVQDVHNNWTWRTIALRLSRVLFGTDSCLNLDYFKKVYK